MRGKYLVTLNYVCVLKYSLRVNLFFIVFINRDERVQIVRKKCECSQKVRINFFLKNHSAETEEA